MCSACEACGHDILLLLNCNYHLSTCSPAKEVLASCLNRPPSHPFEAPPPAAPFLLPGVLVTFAFPHQLRLRTQVLSGDLNSITNVQSDIVLMIFYDPQTFKFPIFLKVSIFSTFNCSEFCILYHQLFMLIWWIFSMPKRPELPQNKNQPTGRTLSRSECRFFASTGFTVALAPQPIQNSQLSS